MSVPASAADLLAVERSSTGTPGIWIADKHRPMLHRHDLDSLDGLLSMATGDRLDKAGLPVWRHRIRLELTDEAGAVQICYLKRYRTPPWRAQLDRLWSGSRRHGTAWLEWVWISRLRADGFNVPEPIAYAERMARGREVASALLIASVPGESLEQRVARQASPVERSMLLGLADFVSRFHELGYVHRDLYLSHVYDGGDGVFHLIDLHRVMRPRWRMGRWLVKDLAALHYSTPLHCASRVDRVRFMRRYLGRCRLSASDKRLIGRIFAKARRTARREVRRDRLADWQRWLLAP